MISWWNGVYFSQKNVVNLNFETFRNWQTRCRVEESWNSPCFRKHYDFKYGYISLQPAIKYTFLQIHFKMDLLSKACLFSYSYSQIFWLLSLQGCWTKVIKYYSWQDMSLQLITILSVMIGVCHLFIELLTSVFLSLYLCVYYVAFLVNSMFYEVSQKSQHTFWIFFTCNFILTTVVNDIACWNYQNQHSPNDSSIN